MSTAPEALTAGYLGVESAALCCISNMLLPPSSIPLSHQSVLDRVRQVAAGLTGFPDRFAQSVYMVL